MKTITEKEIILLMKEEYEAHLKKHLKEVDVFDSRGNLIIGKDLKVKHGPSGYIYTVRGVQGEPGNAKIVLRAPEEPRVKPPPEAGVIEPPKPPQKNFVDSDASLKPGKIHPVEVPEMKGEVIEDSNRKSSKKNDNKDYGKKAYPKVKAPPEQDKGENMFVIDQKEFEKYYKES